jgi:hypothetical protein
MSNTNNKITRTRITAEVKAAILLALQNRDENSTLASIAAANLVSVGAVSQIAAANGLTKRRAPKTDVSE